jgi:hypothetical protein
MGFVSTDSKGRRWIKAEASAQNDCVEVHFREDGNGVDLRDSKNPDGPILSYNNREWAAFVTGIRDGDFDASL